MILEEAVIVEVKAVDRLMPIHQAQLPSYLKLSGCKVGLLINFNVRGLKDGIRRVVNSRFSAFSVGSAVNRYACRILYSRFFETQLV